MVLAPGTQLGPYEIVARVGSGGMGDVYKAHDTRLDRIVAVKVLPAALSRDERARQRFEREARLVAGLSHPHVCALYDVGHQDGVDFLVMEYLDGETLAERLVRGRLPLDQALRYAQEIGEALVTAHTAGIVHRDLKPANVMLTPAGAKLLDFGLAKSRVQSAVSGLSDLGTGEPLTGVGFKPGTLQYMAPEQLEGGEVDARSDIFAFGVVLYEMVTGRRAFEGRSQAALIVKILEAEPAPIRSLVHTVPEALEFIVATCLAKDPAARWQSAHDVLIQLRHVGTERSDPRFAAPTSPTVQGRAWGSRWAYALLGALLGAAVVTMGVLLWPSEPSPQPARARFDVTLSPSLGFDWPDWPIISPNGQQVAFTARLQGRRQLWIRRADASLVPLPGTEGATFAFWSPDSRAVAFFAGRSLKRVEATGGPVTTLADGYSVSRGTWSREGIIVFAPRHNGPLHAVPDTGGTSRAVTALDPARGESSHQFPQFLPDGRHFLYAAAGREPSVRVASLDGVSPRDVLRSFTPAWYAPSGFLVFSRQRSLMAQRFSLETLATQGTAFPIAEPVSGGAFSVAENGTLAFRPGEGGDRQLVWMDREGRRAATLGEPAHYQQVVLSPTGRWAAVQRTDIETGNSDVWLVEVATGIASRLTLDTAIDGDPAWSPDERRFAFTSFRRSRGSVFVYDLVAGREVPLYDLPKEEGEEQSTPASPSLAPARIPEGVAVDDWTSDGQWLVVRSFGRAVYAIPMRGEPEARLLADTPYVEDELRVSPDGRAIAFNSDESGRWEVYVSTFPGLTDKRQVSSGGGMQPRWRRDSEELYYLSLDGAMMAASVRTGPRPQSDVPRRLFHTRLSPSPNVPQYDVSADGNRFLVLEPAHPAGEPLTFLLNWAAALSDEAR